MASHGGPRTRLCHPGSWGHKGKGRTETTCDGPLKAKPVSTVSAGQGLSAQALFLGGLFSTGVRVGGQQPYRDT